MTLESRDRYRVNPIAAPGPPAAGVELHDRLRVIAHGRFLVGLDCRWERATIACPCAEGQRKTSPSQRLGYPSQQQSADLPRRSRLRGPNLGDLERLRLPLT